MFVTTSSIFDSIDRALSQYPGYFTNGSTGGYTTYTTTPGAPAIITTDDWIQAFREHGLGDQTDAFDRAKRAYQDLPAFPATNVVMHRDTGNLEFQIALPGYDMEDIDISFENDNMVVSIKKDNALRKRDKDIKDDVVMFRRGLRSAGLELKVPVPAAKFQIKDATASYVSGILTVQIPRNSETAPIRIKLAGK
jgi:HSP20 family molecular chaperone IbpA